MSHYKMYGVPAVLFTRPFRAVYCLTSVIKLSLKADGELVMLEG